jgi:rhamnosyltransferase
MSFEGVQESMRVSIIIPTKNGGRVFAKCLEGIEKQLCSHDVEIIVVDSRSRDNTVRLARKYGAMVTTIPTQQFTHGGARNIGAALSERSYLVFCNQDAIPANEYWLQNLLAPFERPEIAASYSRQIAPPEAPSCERLFLQHLYPETNRTNTWALIRNRGPEDVVLFSTVSGALRKSVWAQFKFNEDIIMSEDQEIAQRILLSKHFIAYQADSMVFHYHDYSVSDTFRRFFDSGWSMTFLPELRVNSPVKSLHYFATMVGEIANNGNASTSERLYGLIHFFAKTLGFSLGQLAPYLPPALCVMLSHTKKSVAS